MTIAKSASATSSYRILIVDDEPATLQYYAAILQHLGHQVITRDRALGTAPMIIKERPDYVLLDVEMPGLRGHEIIRVLSGRADARRTRFILLSSKSESDLRRISDDCGADGYLCKTTDRAVFVRNIARVFVNAPAHSDR